MKIRYDFSLERFYVLYLYYPFIKRLLPISIYFLTIHTIRFFEFIKDAEGALTSLWSKSYSC